ncbi:hypothetical protein SAMN03080617_00228 [Algoriphagus alkaliphilus]|uniref:Uncharacterized protein n=1 Tax=Algoriphagus alkaliphilus TaxID=279824 RepID=A0A1G5UZQ7_9BACT|nr:hypothetical protein [Algoriphagus alkaliphilus]SDA39121.1 hypothetical protein SAMN03080617_00228 [Algoriphagus alkaliphilus]
METRLKNLFKVVVIAPLFFTTLTVSLGQSDPLGPLMSVTEFTIKPGHEVQFQEGVKAWKSCYLAEKGEWTWRVWQRQQGEGNVYVLASDMPNWAEMDKTDPVGSNCASLVTAIINPHIEKATNHITRLHPALSMSTPTTDELISVGFYELHASEAHKFIPIIREIAASLTKAEGAPRGYWYSWVTMSPDSPNYHVVNPYKNFAAMDITRNNVWDIYEKEHGKEKRDAMQAQFRSTLKNVWTYLYKLNKDMSRPTK